MIQADTATYSLSGVERATEFKARSVCMCTQCVPWLTSFIIVLEDGLVSSLANN